MDLFQILQIESTNHRRIYIYRRKRLLWECYGASALRLHALYGDIPRIDRTICGREEKLPVKLIESLTLGHLLERFVVVEQSEDRIVFELPVASE